ncbi:MAG: phosphoribosylaminoimidazole-succinocarboxamide synthase, partial [Urechidicola sp.]
DVVLANGIPDKGVMLTKISTFWFNFFNGKLKHHLVSSDANEIPGITDSQKLMLAGRIMICRKSNVVPIESIVRGYLTGSGWKDYQSSGMVCGISLPKDMMNSSKIHEPIFTPSTKAATGHDENVSFARACDAVGTPLMSEIRDLSLMLYGTARDYAARRGIIIADTKFEFGQEAGSDMPVLIDEILTPDSSRFWPAEEWQAGREQNSYDKQIVRNYTQALVDKGEWDKEYPGPELPDEVIDRTLARYQEAYDRLTS